MEGLRHYRKPTRGIEDAGGAFLDEEYVVWVASPTGGARAGGGQQCDRTANAEPLIQG